MLVSAARADVTPPVGVRMGGFAARYKGAEGIHDNLYAKAIYLEGRDSSLLLISADVVELPNDVVERARTMLSKRLSIDKGAIMMAATHTHSGPALMPDITSDAELILNRAHTEKYPSLLLEAGEKAAESPVKAFARWGTGRAEIAFNRREEGGPIDPEVIALSLETESGQTIASLVNYACHGVVLGASNYMISADWMGYESGFIEKAFGGEHVSVFTNAADGDLNPITSKGYGCFGTFDDAKRLGTIVGSSALEALKNAPVVKEPQLGLESSTVAVRKVTPSVEQAEKSHQEQLELLEKLKKEGKDPEAIGAQEGVISYTGKNLRLARTMKFSESDDVHVQAFRIGDLALATMPGEPVVKLGLELKRRSPFSPTGLVSYANGYHGYIPVREDYEKGGYESTTTWWNRLASGTGEQLLEEDLRLLGKLRKR